LETLQPTNPKQKAITPKCPKPKTFEKLFTLPIQQFMIGLQANQPTLEDYYPNLPVQGKNIY